MVRQFDSSDQHRALKTYLILIGHATRRETTTYGDLAAKLGDNVQPISVGNYLDPISRYCERNNLPRLTVLAVGKDSGVPSDGYPGPRESIDEDRERVYRYNWYNLIPPTIAELWGS